MWRVTFSLRTCLAFVLFSCVVLLYLHSTHTAVRAAVVTEIHSVTVSSKENQRQFVFAVCRPTRAPRGKHAPWRCGISQPEPVESEPTPPDASTACALILCLAVGDGVAPCRVCVCPAPSPRSTARRSQTEMLACAVRRDGWRTDHSVLDSSFAVLVRRNHTNTDDTSTTRTRIERAPRPPVRPRLLHLVR